MKKEVGMSDPVSPEVIERKIAAIRRVLHPTDPTYCAEPISVEAAQMLLAELDQVRQQLAEATKDRDKFAGELGFMRNDLANAKYFAEAAEAKHAALRTALSALEQEMRKNAPFGCGYWADKLAALLASPSAGTRTTTND